MDRTKLSSILIGTILVSLFVCAFNVQSKEGQDKKDDSQVGLINIDSLSRIKKLSMPLVRFSHDMHTEVLEEQGKDCTTCHEQGDKGLLFTYERSSAVEAPEALKKIYHDNCIGCHASMREEGAVSGPRDGECRECHTGGSGDRSQPFVMEKALHYKHWSSKDIAYRGKDKNCGACHHQYDKETESLFWDKGSEQNCRYCHEDPQDDDVRAMRSAAHDQCVRCHMRKREGAGGGSEVGPVDCKGCHGEKAKREIKRAGRKLEEKMGEIPRLDRGQPRADLIIPASAGKDGKAQKSADGMGPVPFDHRAHETYQDTCRVCHHKSLEACGECHTVSGSKKGDFVQLSQAMHETQSRRSCAGCHEEQKESPSCAGCHDFMPTSEEPGNKDECKACHIQSEEAPSAEQVARMNATSREKTAELFLRARDTGHKLYDREDIPETVTIDVLADKYKGVKMPHRQIVLAMAEDIRGSEMAGYFHREQGTLCQGCHHNSPASKEPPACRSCHGKPFQERNPLMPGIQAAYHQQCMNCHDAMNVKEPAHRDCTACHEKSESDGSAHQ